MITNYYPVFQASSRSEARRRGGWTTPQSPAHGVMHHHLHTKQVSQQNIYYNVLILNDFSILIINGFKANSSERKNVAQRCVHVDISSLQAVLILPGGVRPLHRVY